MDYEAEINKVKDWHAGAGAEAMGMQFVMIGLLHALKGFDPIGKTILDKTFSYAETVGVIAAEKMCGDGTGRYVARISEVVEQLRATVMDDTGQPEGSV